MWGANWWGRAAQLRSSIELRTADSLSGGGSWRECLFEGLHLLLAQRVSVSPDCRVIDYISD